MAQQQQQHGGGETKLTAPTQPARTGGTVTVACKVPNGMVLQLYDFEDVSEPIMGGGWRTVKKAKKVGNPVKVRGPALAVGAPVYKRIAGGYGLTEGVPAEFFAKWLEQNRDADYVLNKMIFAHSSDTVGMAKEHRATRSGYEPLDPKGDARSPRPTANVGRIEQDDDAKELADTE